MTDTLAEKLARLHPLWPNMNDYERDNVRDHVEAILAALANRDAPPAADGVREGEVEFMQSLLDRYSENGGIIDLTADAPGFLRIVRRHAAALAQLPADQPHLAAGSGTRAVDVGGGRQYSDNELSAILHGHAANLHIEGAPKLANIFEQAAHALTRKETDHG